MFRWLRRLWKSKHPETHKQDAPSVSSDSNDSRVENLIKQLAQGNKGEVRLSAVEGLSQLGKDAVPAISALLISATDVDETVRNATLNALNAIDPSWPANVETQKAVPGLVAKLKSQFTDVSTAAFKLLYKIGTAAVPDLVKALSNEQDSIDKFYAIQLLVRISPADSSAIPGLIRALDSELIQVRVAAAKALEKSGPAAEAAVWALAAGLTDKYADGREAKARCLARIGPAAKPAVPTLLPLLADRDEKVRKAAGAALEQIGPTVVPKLIEILQTRNVQRLKAWLESTIKVSELVTRAKSDTEMRKWKIGSESIRIGGPNVIWVFYDIEEARASLEAAQETALQVLGKLGPTASKAVPAVAKALADPNPRIKLAAVQALGQIGPGARIARPDLIMMLAHSNESLRKAAAKALGNIDGDWASDPVIVRAFEGLTKQLNKAGDRGELAVNAFITIGTAAVPVLIDVLGSGDRVARQNAARALGEIGVGAKIAIPVLKRASEDDHPWVQDEATRALAKINNHAN